MQILLTYGYDFVCKNEKCKHYNCAISFHGPWPIVKIDQLIPLDSLSDGYKDHLLEMKSVGQQYALLIYPNVNNLEPVGTRYQFFCENCCIIWDEDVLFGEEKELPVYCKKCSEHLLTVEFIGEEGLNCPHCKEKLVKNSWMTKGK